jgi:hypothetical protein
MNEFETSLVGIKEEMQMAKEAAQSGELKRAAEELQSKEADFQIYKLEIEVKMQKLEEVANTFNLPQKMQLIEDHFPEWDWNAIAHPSEQFELKSDLQFPTWSRNAKISLNKYPAGESNTESWLMVIVFFPHQEDEPVIRINDHVIKPEGATEEMVDQMLLSAVKNPLKIKIA